MTNDMTTRELRFSELDGVTGGDMASLGHVTSVTDINMGIFGTIHVDTVQCGNKTSTAVSYSPYRPA